MNEEDDPIGKALELGSYVKTPRPQKRDIRASGNEKKRMMHNTDITERDVITLRRTGKSFRQISDELNLSGPGAAHKIFVRVMDKDWEITKDAAMAHREEQMHIIDEQLGLLLERQRSDPDNLQVVDRILKVLERKSKLIGLDSAVKTETKVDMALSHEQALEMLDSNNVIDVQDAKQ
tara:strand:+ start:875 stop:1408 length:534 start_codon:yes stop_codon:yes gene_type:complete